MRYQRDTGYSTLPATLSISYLDLLWQIRASDSRTPEVLDLGSLAFFGTLTPEAETADTRGNEAATGAAESVQVPTSLKVMMTRRTRRGNIVHQPFVAPRRLQRV